MLSKLRGDETLPDSATPAEAVAAAYRRLARAPSRLHCVTLEDALVEEHRPNVPGSVRPENWSVPLSVPLDDIVDGSASLAVPPTGDGRG
jgi:4-alpha-glucanotransferase